MATRTWNSGSSTDMNNGANYTGSGALLASDDLVFDGSLSTVNAVATADLAVHSVSVTTGHSGTWSIAGRVLAVAASSTINGGGTRNLGSGITLNGNAITFSIANATMTCSSCVLTSNGTGNQFTDARSAATYKGVGIGASCALTVLGSSSNMNFFGPGPVLVAGENAIFTNNCTVFLGCTTASDLYSLASTATWRGNSAVYFIIDKADTATTLRDLRYTGTSSVYVNGYVFSGGVFNIAGNINIGSNILFVVNTNSGISITVNFGSSVITCGQLRVGGADGCLVTTVNYNSATINCTQYNAASYNSGTTNENWGSAAFNCSGSVSIGSNHVISRGSSVWTILNTGTATIAAPATQKFDALNLNAPGKTLTLASDLYCRQFALIAGTVAYNGHSIFRDPVAGNRFPAAMMGGL